MPTATTTDPPPANSPTMHKNSTESAEDWIWNRLSCMNAAATVPVGEGW